MKAELKRYFGYDSFRPGQQEVVEAAVQGRDVLCIMPTGGGKSICYQLPALAMDGISLVISPLLSLMKDQVTTLVNNGVKGAYLNSSLTFSQMRMAMQRARDGWYKIIYVTPERLVDADFIDFAKNANISMVTVDEAHCVSQWGHDFRQSYLNIAAFVDSLPSRPVVTAFTATATAQVREDIIDLLKLKEPFLTVTGFDRGNLKFSVIKPANKRLALLEFLKLHRKESSIIYCTTRKTVEELCELLQDKGYSATRYHAGLSTKEREENQEAFVFEQCSIMVATNAFGMGIDKSNVRNVLHYNMPKNIEAYYQEAGRAGRDGEPAECLLMYGPSDVKTNEFLIRKGLEEEKHSIELVEGNLELLKQMTSYATSSCCLRHFILDYFGEPSPLACGNCGNCELGTEEVDISDMAAKILACVEYFGIEGRGFERGMIAGILKGSMKEEISRRNLHKNRYHGQLSGKSFAEIRDCIEELKGLGYLSVTDGEYPVLKTTEKACQLKQGEKIVVTRLKKPEKRAIKAEPPPTAYNLMDRLKKLRMDISIEERMPAYTVFSDATLRDMCERRPLSIEGMSEVTGVNMKKLQKYGQRFLKEINL